MNEITERFLHSFPFLPFVRSDIWHQVNGVYFMSVGLHWRYATVQTNIEHLKIYMNCLKLEDAIDTW